MRELWRELIEALEETLALYRYMLELSGNKKDVLVRGKPVELEAINREEESLLLQGKELEHRRAKATAVLVTAWDMANAKPSLDELAAVATPDDGERLHTLKQEFAATLKELSRLNAVNAKLTEQALAFVNYNLNLLTRRQAEPTYAPAGAAAFKGSAMSAALLDRKV